MKINRLAAPALALLLISPSSILFAQYNGPQGPPPPPGGYDRDHDRGGWDGPPDDYRDREIARRGFHDGVEGARRDVENHRRPNVNNRDEFRHPEVDHHDRREYREAFRRGYEVGIQHLLGGPRPY